MKICWKHVVIGIVAYEVVAWLWNKSSSTTTQLPLDGISALGL